jgi:hypothetical protein
VVRGIDPEKEYRERHGYRQEADAREAKWYQPIAHENRKSRI